MRPTYDTALSRPDLGMAVFETLQSAPTMGYIGLQLLPIFRVPVFSAEYPVIPSEALFNLLETRRGPLGHYNRYDGEFEAGWFKTSEYGLERPIDDRYAKIYASKFAYELTIANILMQDILRAQEARIAEKLFNPANFDARAMDTIWSNFESTPRVDIEAGKAALRAVGIIPNRLVLNHSAWVALRQNADVQTKIFQLFPDAARTGTVSIEHLKTYFDVPQIVVAGAMANSADRGKSAVLADIWGSRYAMLCRVAEGDTADIIEPCIGRTFMWNEGASQEVVVEEYYSDEVRSRILRVRHDVAEAFLASFDANNNVKSEISRACGVLFDTTTAG